MNNILVNHSEIIDYPINYELFPKTKNIEFIEFDLYKNEYLLIPSNWIHLVITDPQTFALSFEITEYDGADNNILYNKMKNNEPYKSKGNDVDFNYNSFIENTKERKFSVLFSESDDCSPVIKNNKIKYFKDITLENALNESIKRNLYTYIGSNDLNDYNYDDLETISKFINHGKDIIISYNTTIWLTLNNKIQSGIHYDTYDKLLYVLSGKKKVLLLPPKHIDKIYIKKYYLVNRLSNIN